MPYVLAILVVLALTAAIAPVGAQLTLAREGRSDYVIVVAEGAQAPEWTAARELQSHLQAVTGARLPVRAQAEAPAKPWQIVVGPGERLRQAAPDVDLAALGHDGIVMRTVGDTLYLAGGRPRGTLYAVYSFLEEEVGCRWWTWTESYLPSRPTLTVPALNQVYVPQLQYREAYCRGVNASDGVFAARLKSNGNAAPITAEYGGHYTLLGWCHTFKELLPPETYFAAHPEWYSEVDGQRADYSLCLTNEAMRAELTRQALEWIRANPTAGMISISQPDGGTSCQCAACRQVVAEEGAESGLLLRFVNAVAEEIEKQYPDFLVETLAYSYTRRPPQVTHPRHNVLVRLCTNEYDFGQPLGSGERNRSFQDSLAKWSAISPQLFIWNYCANFGGSFLLPYPNLDTLADDIRTFVANKTIGLFEHGDPGSTCGDFIELRAWLVAHLMWDPSRDEHALIREFLRGYYGAAGEPLQEYLDLRTRALERSQSGVYVGLELKTADWLTDKDLTRSRELFDRAAQLVREDVGEQVQAPGAQGEVVKRNLLTGQVRVRTESGTELWLTPVLSTRVRRARVPLDYACLQGVARMLLRSHLGGEPSPGMQDLVARVEDFITTVEGFGGGQYAEGREFEELAGRLRELVGSPDAELAGRRLRELAGMPDAPAPWEMRGRSPQDWFEVQEDVMRLEPGLAEDVDDPMSSNGRSARMPGSHSKRGVQYQFPGDRAKLGPWRVWASVRAAPRAATGEACQLGIYDSQRRENLAVHTTRLEDLPGCYWLTVDLGVHTLTGDCFVWVAPRGNSEAVEAVYVDRFFFSREAPQ